MEMGPTLLGAKAALYLLLRTDGKIWRVTETERRGGRETDTQTNRQTDGQGTFDGGRQRQRDQDR